MKSVFVIAGKKYLHVNANALRTAYYLFIFCQVKKLCFSKLIRKIFHVNEKLSNTYFL